jgi:hypothetical protein
MTMRVRSPTSHEPTDSSLDRTSSVVCEADLAYAGLATWQLSLDYQRLVAAMCRNRSSRRESTLSVRTLLGGVTGGLDDDPSADFYGVIGESFVVAA